MPERATEEGREGLFAEVAERRVPEVVPEGDGLGEVFVQADRSGGGARDLRDLERVREAHPVVIALRGDEDLGLVLQPPECLRVHDAVPVTLERRPERMRRLLTFAALRLGREDGAFGQRPSLDVLDPFPRCAAHRLSPATR